MQLFIANLSVLRQGDFSYIFSYRQAKPGSEIQNIVFFNFSVSSGPLAGIGLNSDTLDINFGK